MGQYAGASIVLTAPLTESIDHAGFFIQMSLASIPGWMEWVIDKEYPTWRAVPTTADGAARPRSSARARVDQVVVCYPEQLPEFIGERTRVVAVSHGRSFSSRCTGPGRWLERTGRTYAGQPLPRVTRDDLLATVRPDWRQAIAGARESTAVARARVFKMAAV